MHCAVKCRECRDLRTWVAILEGEDLYQFSLASKSGGREQAG